MCVRLFGHIHTYTQARIDEEIESEGKATTREMKMSSSTSLLSHQRAGKLQVYFGYNIL